MTSRKRVKKHEREERLRVRKSNRLPRRPYEPQRPRSTGRDRLSKVLIELGHALERADAEGHRLLERDYSKLLRFKDSGESDAGLLCQEPDGSLISVEGLQARHPGYVQIILPPKDADESSDEETHSAEAPETTEPLAAIVEYPIAGAPGWRLAFVPPSRINLIPLRAPLDEADNAE